MRALMPPRLTIARYVFGFGKDDFQAVRRLPKAPTIPPNLTATEKANHRVKLQISSCSVLRGLAPFDNRNKHLIPKPDF